MPTVPQKLVCVDVSSMEAAAANRLFKRRDGLIPLPVFVSITPAAAMPPIFPHRKGNRESLIVEHRGFVLSEDVDSNGFVAVKWGYATSASLTVSRILNITRVHQSMINTAGGNHMFAAIRVPFSTNEVRSSPTAQEVAVALAERAARLQSLLSPTIATTMELNPYFIRTLVYKEPLVEDKHYSVKAVPISFLSLLAAKTKLHPTASPTISIVPPPEPHVVEHNRSGGKAEQVSPPSTGNPYSYVEAVADEDEWPDCLWGYGGYPGVSSGATLGPPKETGPKEATLFTSGLVLEPAAEVSTVLSLLSQDFVAKEV